MAVRDPKAWVKKVEMLYHDRDADGLSALYTDDATTKYGSLLMPPEWVHAHPRSWFESLEDYRITRTLRAAFGDTIVSETRASYVWAPSADLGLLGPDAESEGAKVPGRRYREYGTDIYWVNDEGRVYHKHTIDLVEPYELGPPMDREH